MLLNFICLTFAALTHSLSDDALIARFHHSMANHRLRRTTRQNLQIVHWRDGGYLVLSR